MLTPHDALGSDANKLQGSLWVSSQKVSEPLNLQAATSGQFGDELVAVGGRQLSPIPVGRGRGHMFSFRIHLEVLHGGSNAFHIDGEARGGIVSWVRRMQYVKELLDVGIDQSSPSMMCRAWLVGKRAFGGKCVRDRGIL